MSRWVWFSLCAILGLVMLVCGLLVPAHLRAVDASVLHQAGRNTPALIERGLVLVRERNLGPAQLLLKAAQQKGIPDREKLDLAVANLAEEQPGLLVWGGAPPAKFPVTPVLDKLYVRGTGGTTAGSQPFTELVVRLENREKILELLRVSPSPLLQELQRFRAVTHTAIFPHSQSSSGQALDAALSICGLLSEERRLTKDLSNVVLALASTANRGNSIPLEEVLLDFMSLGQRLNYAQLVAFVGQIEDAETLRLLANHVRKSDAQLPVLFSAVELSGQPAVVAKYLMKFSQTGLKDLGDSLRFGTGGVKELLQRNQQLHHSGFRQRVAGQPPFGGFISFASDYSLLLPGLALSVKWLLYLGGGFLLAMAMHFARPAVPVMERPLQVRGFHVAREVLFALGFLLVVLLLSEPFLSQESQRGSIPLRPRLPTVGSALAAGTPVVNRSIMNQLSLLTLLLFFVLQGLIYIACLVKLAEIRRQNISSRIKLKLLDNEEHLFDAGLYLGFAGTIISLIMVSMGVIKPSLMAAYSSTSFGIIFVSVFKIFHLRPLRRQLLLEVESALTEPAVSRATHPLAAPL